MYALSLRTKLHIKSFEADHLVVTANTLLSRATLIGLGRGDDLTRGVCELVIYWHILRFKSRQSEEHNNIQLSDTSYDLALAAYFGNVEFVQEQLAAGTDNNFSSQCLGSPIWAATLGNQSAIVILLIEAGASVHDTRAISISHCLSDFKTISLLLKSARAADEPKSLDAEINEAIYYIARQGRISDIQIFSRLVGNVGLPTTCCFGAIRGGHTGLALEMIERGVHLHELRLFGNNYSKQTLLDEACFAGNKLVFDRLIQKDAAPQIANPLLYTSRIPSISLAASAGQLSMVQTLLYNGANLEVTQIFAFGSPLLRACERGNLEIAQFLIERGALINTVHSFYRYLSPLCAAAFSGNVHLVEFLLHNGADPNLKRSECSATALACACLYGHRLIASTLVAHGANIEDGGIPTRTPAQIASDIGYHDVAAFLVKKGAKSPIERCPKVLILDTEEEWDQWYFKSLIGLTLPRSKWDFFWRTEEIKIM
jgi:ankyrin repeat protein